MERAACGDSRCLVFASCRLDVSDLHRQILVCSIFVSYTDNALYGASYCPTLLTPCILNVTVLHRPLLADCMLVSYTGINSGKSIGVVWKNLP